MNAAATVVRESAHSASGSGPSKRLPTASAAQRYRYSIPPESGPMRSALIVHLLSFRSNTLQWPDPASRSATSHRANSVKRLALIVGLLATVSRPAEAQQSKLSPAEAAKSFQVADDLRFDQAL